MLLEGSEDLGFGHVPSLRDGRARVFEVAACSSEFLLYLKVTDGSAEMADKLAFRQILNQVCFC